MKKSILVLLLIEVLLALSCSPSGEEGRPKVGLVVSTLNNPFFVSLTEGAKKEAQGANFELLILDSQNDPAKELANVEDLLIQKVEMILINPTDSDAVGTAVALANRHSVPVLTLDRGASTGEVVSHIASDNVAGGRMAGEYIARLLKGEGRVVELEGIPGTSAARDRGKGFNAALAETAIRVVARQTADFDRTQGLHVMENILQGQEKVDAVFAHNDEMALGALKAIEAAGLDIPVVGFDAIDDAITAVQEGKMAATVAQQPELIGKMSIETTKKYLAGEPLDAYFPVELTLVQNGLLLY